MSGLAGGSKSHEYHTFQYRHIDTSLTPAYRNFTAPRSKKHFKLSRDVSSEDVDQMKMEKMPGFRFSWWYTGAVVTSDPKYKDEQINKHFVRLAYVHT